ncbi:MAG: efflux family protein [Pseudonocardiales bacterium]|nr:efflux family protein [Pseudonocardiales bacterium]
MFLRIHAYTCPCSYDRPHAPGCQRVSSALFRDQRCKDRSPRRHRSNHGSTELTAPRGIDREIGRLTLPAFGALAAEPIFLISDTAIIGHLGTAQLAGLGVGSAILLNLVNLCLFLTFSATASVARSIGSGNPRRAATQVVDSLWLAASIGVLLALCLGLFSSKLISLFDPPSSAHGYARSYLDISLAGIPSMLVVLAATGCLRGLGDAWTPLKVAIGSGLVNIGLNVILVYGAGLGIAGSALGTAITQTLTAVWLVLLVVERLRPHEVSLLPDPRGVRSVGVTSFALFLRTLTLRVALLAMTYVATRQGQVALASHQTCLTISGLMELPAGALGVAAQVIVGRSLGAGHTSLARQAASRALRWGLATGAVLAVVLVAARQLLVPLLSPDPAVRHELVAVLLVLALLQPIGGVLYVLDGVFIGAGDGRYLALAGVTSLVAFLPLLALVLVFRGGLVALWFALGAYLLARLATLLTRLRSDLWLVTGAAA